MWERITIQKLHKNLNIFTCKMSIHEVNQRCKNSFEIFQKIRQKNKLSESNALFCLKHDKSSSSSSPSSLNGKHKVIEQNGNSVSLNAKTNTAKLVDSSETDSHKPPIVFIPYVQWYPFEEKLTTHLKVLVITTYIIPFCSVYFIESVNNFSHTQRECHCQKGACFVLLLVIMYTHSILVKWVTHQTVFVEGYNVVALLVRNSWYGGHILLVAQCAGSNINDEMWLIIMLNCIVLSLSLLALIMWWHRGPMHRMFGILGFALNICLLILYSTESNWSFYSCIVMTCLMSNLTLTIFFL